MSGAVPELRFPEFTGAIKPVKLSEVAIFSKGKGVSKSDIDPNGSLPCVRYGELYTVYGTVIDEPVSRTPVPAKDLILSMGGEVLVPASGETAKDIATAAVVKRPGVAIGGDLNIIRSDHDGAYLASYLSGRKRLVLAAMAQGNSVVHLYAAQLGSLDVHLPDIEEERKISKFLEQVDAKLAALRVQADGLRQFKTGMMQRLFSQELRFTREDGSDFPDWDERELQEIGERSKVKNSGIKITRVLTNSATMGVIDQGDYFDKDIANAENIGGYYVIRKGEFIYNPRISVSAPVGPINRNDLADGVMSPLYTVFRINLPDTDFFAHYFASTMWHDYMKSVANYGARHDRMAISIGDFLALPLPVPHADERAKIAGALSALDAKIDAMTAQITHMEAFKKGLLQKMFV